MDKIEITIESIGDNKNLVISENNIKINGVNKEIIQDKIDDLLRIVRNWEEVIVSRNIIDDKKITVKIHNGDKTKTLYSNNNLEFLKWVAEIDR